MMTKEDEKIREIAYNMWLEEGKPEGKKDLHWKMAKRIVAVENAIRRISEAK